MNNISPSNDGEFETIDAAKEIQSFCPQHYIKEVQCRYADDKTTVFDFVKCDNAGSTCRNNGS